MAQKPYANKDGLTTDTTSRRSASERVWWQLRKGLSLARGTLCVPGRKFLRMSIKLIVATIITSVLAISTIETRGKLPTLNMLAGVSSIALSLWWAYFLNLEDKDDVKKIRKLLGDATRGIAALATLIFLVIVVPVFVWTTALMVVYLPWLIIKVILKMF